MTDSEKPWLIALGVLSVGFVGYYVYHNDKEEKRQKLQRRVRKTRTLVKDLPGSRDLEEPIVPKSTDEKLSSPRILAQIDSTRTRSSGIFPKSSPTTSKLSLISIRPSNGSEGSRKYPIEYYSLSKKAQWKFRKRNIISLSSVI